MHTPITTLFCVIFLRTFYTSTIDSQKDLVQANETHLEGVPIFIQHPKPLSYTMKDRPATIECIAEPVSHAVIECAEQVIPYKGPGESGRLKVTRLDSSNRPDPEGSRWHLMLQVRAKEVEEWFDSYVCRCEAWNKVIKLQRPKKVISHPAIVIEAYLERKFKLEPTSTTLNSGSPLNLVCIPPEGKPTPEIYWMKDGKRINTIGFPQIQLDDFTHLLIKNTTQHDSGNYTCVAGLLGIEYRYATAQVHIRVAKPIEHVQVIGNPKTTVTEATPFSKAPEVAIYAGAFLFMAAVLLIFTILFFRKRGFKSTAVHWLLHPCCMQGKRSCHREMNGKIPHDPLLLDEYKQSWATIANPTALRPQTIVIQPNDPTLSIGQLLPTQNMGARIDQSVYDTVETKRGMEGQTLLYANSFNTLDASQTSSNCRYFPTPPTQLPPPPPMLSMPSSLIAPANNSQNSDHSDYLTDNGRSCNYFSDLAQPGYMIKNQLLKSTHLLSNATNPYMHARNNNSTTRALSMWQRSQELRMDNIEHQNDQSVSNAIKASPEGQSSLNSTTNTTTVSSGKEDGINGQIFNNSDLLMIQQADASVYDLYAKPMENMSKDSTDWLDEIKSRIGPQGGELSLGHTGVSLRIPTGSFAVNTDEEVRLAVCHEDTQPPALNDGQTMISPIVSFGLSDWVSKQPVMLVMQHCADLKHGNWLIQLMGARLPNTTSQKPNDPSVYFISPLRSTDQIQWEVIQTIGQPSMNPDIECLLETTMAQLRTRIPGLYCLVGQTAYRNTTTNDFDQTKPEENFKQQWALPGPQLRPIDLLQNMEACKPYARKLLHIAAFAKPPSSSMDCVIRVYIVPATTAALDHVIRFEGATGGRCLATADSFGLRDNGIGLSFHIRAVKPGWRSRLLTEKQEIPFRHIWSGIQTSMLHCSFSLEHVDPTQLEVECDVTVFQGTGYEAEPCHLRIVTRCSTSCDMEIG